MPVVQKGEHYSKAADVASFTSGESRKIGDYWNRSKLSGHCIDLSEGTYGRENTKMSEKGV